MAIPRSPVLSGVNVNRGGRTSRVAPAAPANGSKYTPTELEAMTSEQQLWLAEHPRFWLPRASNPEDSGDDFRDTLQSPGCGASNTDASEDGDVTMTHSDGTIKGKAWQTPNELGLSGISGLAVAGPSAAVSLPPNIPPLTLPAPRITDNLDTSTLTRLHDSAV